MSPTPAGGASTGWRRTGPSSTTGWIEHDPANAEQALAELHAAAARNPASALRRAVERQPGYASAEAVPGDLVRIAGVTPGDRPAVITAAVSAGTPRTTPPSRPS